MTPATNLTNPPATGPQRIEDLTRREFMSSALAAALLIACGDDEDEEPAGQTSGSFPVTIEHKFGTTAIDTLPSRVVSLGLNEHDILYELGVAPVGVRLFYPDYEHGTMPWAEDAAEGAGPETLGREIDFEKVAALRPDLIVAIYSGITAEEYDVLSQIAPVVAQPAEFEDWTTPWRHEVRIIAAALGRTDAGEAIIGRVDGRIAEAREAYPEFEGATINAAGFHDGQFGSYSSGDLANRLFQDLGFVIPPVFDELADGIFVSFSVERIDLLDLDVVVWQENRESDVLGLAPYGGLRLAREARSVWLGDNGVLAAAIAFQSPLSIEYQLEHLAPLLAAAIDGDPSTVVE